MNTCERTLVGTAILVVLALMIGAVWRNRREWLHTINAHRIESQAKMWGMPE
jgi:hypothetical protein